MSYELQSYSGRNSFSVSSDRFSFPAAGKSFVLPSIASVSVSSAEPNETASVLTAPVEDWMEEMQRLEDMEKLAKITQDSVPKILLDDLNRIIDIFPGYQRMSIYTICQALHYDSEYLRLLIDIVNRIEGIVKLPTILFIELLISHSLHIQCLHFFTLLHSPIIADFIQTLETKQGIEMIELCKYQPSDSLIRMSEEINVVGGVEMHKMYVHIRTHTYQQKHCQLCKTKRIHQLEFRMVYKENPSDVLPIPAMLSQYETHEYVHAASDCRYYSFNETLGKVFWHKHPVDLVNICDVCIKEVHEGVSNISRNEEYHHIDASVRFQFVAYLHSQEDKLASIISQIAYTRALRRLKECMGTAHKHYLHGKAGERHSEWHKQDLLDRRQGFEEKLSAHHRLVEGALVVDQKWKLVDKHSDLKALQKRLNYASMQKHQGYSDVKPASKQRKHSKSWQLNDYDEDGLPLTAEAARKEFGHEVEVEHVDAAPDIEQWKHEANDIASMLKRKREAQRRRQREEEIRKFEELKDYVRERTVVLDRHQKQMERIAAQMETDRLAKRAAEREGRRQERFAKYLEQERYMMQEEDRRSGEMRFHGFEKRREEFERIRMYDEEMEQCEVDRFWGIDYYENMMAQEELRLRKFYEDRVKYKNEQLVIMKSITNFKAPKFTTFGTLPEDQMYESNQERRLAVIRKLKAEEIRSDLKYRLPYVYSGSGKKKDASNTT